MIVLLFITNILFIYGLNFLFLPNQILNPVHSFILQRFNPEKVIPFLKPIYLCPPCMSSVYGSIFYLYNVNCSFLGLLVYVIALCGSIRFTNNIINFE